MLEHDADGAAGVVLNRPIPDVAVDDIEGLDRWQPYASEPMVLFAGGPVDLNALVGLARLDGPTSAAWAEVAYGVSTVDLHADPTDEGLVVHALRVFRGYSGWGPGQLEGELAVGAWIVLDALLDDVFGMNGDELWRSVLRRQGGRLSWIANAPDDLSMN